MKGIILALFTLSRTAPYMYNGVYQTLEQVMDFTIRVEQWVWV
jgi:cytochrome c peroxidase